MLQFTVIFFFLNLIYFFFFFISEEITQTEKAKFGELCQHQPGRLWFARYVNSQVMNFQQVSFLACTFSMKNPTVDNCEKVNWYNKHLSLLNFSMKGQLIYYTITSRQVFFLFLFFWVGGSFLLSILMTPCLCDVLVM